MNNQEQSENKKDITREHNHWRNKMDREFKNPVITPIMVWIMGIVFTAGCLYTFVMRIPSIEKAQTEQALKINTIETNYAQIEKWMEKIDRKLDRGNK